MIRRTRVIAADPPWSFGDKLPGGGRGAIKHYACMSIDEKGTDEDWNRFFSDYIAKLDPDTLVTVVDCHI